MAFFKAVALTLKHDQIYLDPPPWFLIQEVGGWGKEHAGLTESQVMLMLLGPHS